MRNSWAKTIPLVGLGLPVLEILLFVAVATWIGVLDAILLQVACSLVGVAVLRSAGWVRVDRVGGSLSDGIVHRAEIDGAGLVRLLAGILLFVPGFLTDALGTVLLIPPARRWFGATLRRWAQQQARAAQGTRVVDLSPDEWKVQDSGARRQEPERIDQTRRPPDAD